MLKQKCATYENPTCKVVYCLYTLNSMHIKAGCGYKPTATPVSPAHFMNSLLVNCYMPLHRLFKHASFYTYTTLIHAACLAIALAAQL